MDDKGENMKKYNSVEISKLDKDWEYTDDNVEVGSLNEFFNVDFTAYFVKLVNNRYVGVVGVDENTNAFLLM
jgi:hypothetical protein